MEAFIEHVEFLSRPRRGGNALDWLEGEYSTLQWKKNKKLFCEKCSRKEKDGEFEKSKMKPFRSFIDVLSEDSGFRFFAKD